MTKGRAVLWCVAGLLLGAAGLAGGQGDDDRRAKLMEIERLAAQLRALEGERPGFPPPDARGFEPACFPVGDLTLPVIEFCRPHPWPRIRESVMYSGPDEEAYQHYGTIEELAELVRSRVRPDVWESGAEIVCRGHCLLLFAPPDVNRAARALLDGELRPAARRTIHLELEIVEADAPLAGALADAAGRTLDAELRGRLDAALAAGGARLAFAGCVRGLSHQPVVLWHGAQEAMVADAKVEGVDVDVAYLGTIAGLRTTAGDDAARVRIDLGYAALDQPVRTAETAKAGTLAMPARATTEFQADLRAEPGRWTVAGERTGADGKRRFLLVRPSVIGGAS